MKKLMLVVAIVIASLVAYSSISNDFSFADESNLAVQYLDVEF